MNAAKAKTSIFAEMHEYAEKHNNSKLAELVKEAMNADNTAKAWYYDILDLDFSDKEDETCHYEAYAEKLDDANEKLEAALQYYYSL